MQIESFDGFKNAQAKDYSLLIRTELKQGSQGCSHTQSLNPTKGYANLLAPLTNSVGESMLVKNRALESSRMPKNHQPTKERAEGYKYPTSKN